MNVIIREFKNNDTGAIEAIQFNSVISTNIASVRLWEELGFIRAGRIKNAFIKY